MKSPIPARDPTQPVAYETSDVAAIQAMATGAATAGQQVEALRWIVEMAAGTYDLSYRGDPYATAFAEGRRFVGLNIVKLSKLRMDIVRGETPVKDPS